MSDTKAALFLEIRVRLSIKPDFSPGTTKVEVKIIVLHLSINMRGLLTASVAFAGLVCALPSPIQQRRQDGWPYAPFTTSGRDIKNTQGDTVTYAGVNWPGAADAMLPEGLQYSSIADIVSKIKSLGMNSIRLTYAIEMVDDIYSNNPNSSLEGTLVNALGQTNGTKVLGQILEKNPDFTASTTRLEVCRSIHSRRVSDC